MTHHGKVAIGALVLMLLGSTARTQAAPSATPSAEAQKEAKGHFARGKAFQAKDDFDAAIAAYKAAYDLMPLPDLIFNIAQCERLKGDKRAALDDFQRYLVIAPNGRGAAEAQAFVATLGPEVSEAERRRKEQQEKDEQARREQPALALTAEDVQAHRGIDASVAPAPSPATPPVPMPASAPATEGRGRTLRTAGLVTAGVGAALVVTGAVFGLKARSANDDLDKLSKSSGATWNEGLYQSFQTDKKMMFILGGIGGAAILGGGLTYLLGRRAETEHPMIALVPNLGGGTVTLAFALR